MKNQSSPAIDFDLAISSSDRQIKNFTHIVIDKKPCAQ